MSSATQTNAVRIKTLDFFSNHYGVINHLARGRLGSALQTLVLGESGAGNRDLGNTKHMETMCSRDLLYPMLKKSGLSKKEMARYYVGYKIRVRKILADENLLPSEKVARIVDMTRDIGAEAHGMKAGGYRPYIPNAHYVMDKLLLGATKNAIGNIKEGSLLQSGILEDFISTVEKSALNLDKKRVGGGAFDPRRKNMFDIASRVALFRDVALNGTLPSMEAHSTTSPIAKVAGRLGLFRSFTAPQRPAAPEEMKHYLQTLMNADFSQLKRRPRLEYEHELLKTFEPDVEIKNFGNGNGDNARVTLNKQRVPDSFQIPENLISAPHADGYGAMLEVEHKHKRFEHRYYQYSLRLVRKLIADIREPGLIKKVMIDVSGGLRGDTDAFIKRVLRPFRVAPRDWHDGLELLTPIIGHRYLQKQAEKIELTAENKRSGIRM